MWSFKDAYVAALVNVSWFKSDAIRYNPAISLPEYRIASVSPNYCNGTYRCLVATIRLERSLGFTLVQSYIPTSLIVIISWVSFWIDRSAVPARVTLSFSTMLSLTTLGNGLRYGLPQVSYAKAIDYWFGACMCFVFCSLLQFAVVNSYMRKSEKNDKLSARHLQKAGQINYSTAAMPIYGLHQINRELLEKLKCKDKKRASASHVKADSNVISMDDADRLLLLNNIYEAYIKDTEPQNAEANKLSDRSMKRLENSATLRQLLLDGIFKEPELILAEYHAQLANKYSHVALSIDKSCRYIFPLAFILWNLAYWGYYLLNDPLFASRR
ncbi:unnamed protein product [Anisakis simplex]|uniref:Neur_chan_memb domain-containing protein n=1 Tax=Anisakis simplex TaxID=6269 RepID=A0A0M3K013_ANISI|nr:unnamed protein product [Anisakis simplex]